MTILFSSTRAIKPSNPRFAFPIQVPKPPPVRPYSDADARWHAEQLDRRAKCEEERRTNQAADRAAEEWANQNSIERGVIYC